MYVLALVRALCGTPARAQSTGFAVDRFEPAAAGSQWLSLDSLDLRGHLRTGAALSADLALRPVVIYDRSGKAVAPLVNRQAMLHADAAMVLWNRVRLDLELPLVVWQRGMGGEAAGMTFTPPTGEILGDVRFGAEVRLYGETGDRVTIAAGARLFFPTGHQSAFTSDGGLRVWPHLAGAGRWDQLVWAASLGYHIRPTYKCSCALTPGSEMTAGAAVGYEVAPRWRVGPELYASTAVASGRFATAVGSPVELLLGGHYAVAPEWEVGVGAAPGLTNGAGSPSWRFVTTVQYWPLAAAPKSVNVSAFPSSSSASADPRSTP